MRPENIAGENMNVYSKDDVENFKAKKKLFQDNSIK